MTDLDSIRSILYSRSIDSSNVKPYTGIHLNQGGDVILSTPSLDSYRVNNDPIYRYQGNISPRRPAELDNRILSYNSLEHRRYQSLRMRQPSPRYVSRIFEERFGSMISPRAEPSRTVRLHTAPGYRLIIEQIPNQDQTMVPQRFNKLSPFVTENENKTLRESVA